MPSEVEESLVTSEVSRDVSTPLDMTSQDGSRAVGRIAWLDVVAMTDGGEVVAKEDRNSERDQHNGNRTCE
jgi:hypothetical protein